VHLELHPGVGRHELAHRFRQDVENGGFTGADLEFPRLQLAEVGGEAFLQLVDAVHQGLGKLEQDFTLGGQLEMGAAPLEQHHGKFPLQGLDLQGNRGLGTGTACPPPWRCCRSEPPGRTPAIASAGCSCNTAAHRMAWKSPINSGGRFKRREFWGIVRRIIKSANIQD
jgi:hypothetical protein